MAELIAVGPRDFILGFRLAGVKQAFSDDETDVAGMLEALLGRKEQGVVVLHSGTFAGLDRRLQARLKASVRPVLVVLGAEGEEEENLREDIRRAMGIDLVPEDEEKK